MTDPIADMLTRIRNASAVRKAEVVLPMSKIKYEVAKILERENWIQKCETVDGEIERGRTTAFSELKLTLKYKKSGKSTMTSLKRISKPGLRVYVDKNNIPVVLNGFGMAIISTSKGLMTTKEAKKNKIGGEVVCEIY